MPKIQSVPPQYWWKSAWYHEPMDSLIDNNTQDLHWQLTLSESKCLLSTLFPNHELFQESVKPCPTTLFQPPVDMSCLLEDLWKAGVYGKHNTNKGSDKCWKWAPSTNRDEAKFLNDTLTIVK